MQNYLGWSGIVRLGLVQMALGGIVVLATSSFNRIMVKELLLPATLPGLLFGIHYAAEMLRPRWGHGSDKGGSRSPWIIRGLAVLGLSCIGAAGSIAFMSVNPTAGYPCAILAYTGIGFGAGAAGTSLLVLLAKLASPDRKRSAAAVVWTMMIAGTAISAGIAGKVLDPFSVNRLLAVTAGISAFWLTVAVFALWGIERRHVGQAQAAAQRSTHSFLEAIRDVWSEPETRRMTWFISISMFAYSAQEFLLEPFAATVFDWTVGGTASLISYHRSSTVLGMAAGAILGSLSRKNTAASKFWVAGGCFASAMGLFAMAAVGAGGASAFVITVACALGFANGVYAVAAIGTMISLASVGKPGREGVRMGLWGAGQAIAFGLGGVIGGAAVDVARHFLGTPGAAYSLLFAVQGVLFVVASGLAFGLTSAAAQQPQDEDSELSVNTSAQAVGEAGARMT
jgi:MFS transporter, BCD family, chlorophyll transporter